MKERNLIVRSTKMIRTKFNFEKIFLFLFILLITFTLSACGVDPQPNEKTELEDIALTIYTLNDFHGTIEENGNMAGIYKIGDFLIKEKQKSPETTLIISAGDMFQGTAVSSMTRGRAVVDAMNIIGFDAMTLGNHEFDWGIDVVLKYQDGKEENGEVNFPFLAANIIDKKSNELITKPYTIVEKSGYKIGIIGIIGSDQTKDILASYVENYEFTDEITAIKKYTKVLRSEEKCDIVIISAHCDTQDYGNKLSSLSDDYKIDAIINGHTHQAYYGELNFGDREAPLPYVQSGCYGQYVGKIVLQLNGKERKVINASANNLKAKTTCKTENIDIKNAISKYSKEMEVSKEVLGVSGETVYQNEGGKWAANVIATYEDAVVGIINSGGIRRNGFPLEIDKDITYGDIFEIMPFENKIKVVSIKGYELEKLANYSGLFISDSLSKQNGTVYINGEPIDANEYYRVATIDYLYEKTNYPFKTGLNPVDTDILFRDALAEAVKKKVSEKGKFYTN